MIPIPDDTLRGFWDSSQPWGGPVTGHGPNFDHAVQRYARRMIEESKVGKWRKSPARWKKNDGSYIDRDWDIVDY